MEFKPIKEPPPTSTRGAPAKYPFAGMAVGEGRQIEVDNPSNARRAFHMWCRRSGWRGVTQQEKNKLTVWRIS